MMMMRRRRRRRHHDLQAHRARHALDLRNEMVPSVLSRTPPQHGQEQATAIRVVITRLRGSRHQILVVERGLVFLRKIQRQRGVQGGLRHRGRLRLLHKLTRRTTTRIWIRRTHKTQADASATRKALLASYVTLETRKTCRRQFRTTIQYHSAMHAHR